MAPFVGGLEAFARYGDQPIPEEESHYVFVQPVPGEVLCTYG